METHNPQGDHGALSFIEKARRAQIVEATIDTIVSIGYSRASLAEIAKRANISKGVISYHFAGKADLIQQVVSEIYSRAFDAIAPSVDAESSAAAKLRALIESNLHFLRTHQKYIFALNQIWANRSTDIAAAAEIENKHEHGLDHLQRLLQRGQETGEFRSFDSRTMSLVIRNTVDMATNLAGTQQDFDWDRFSSELTSLFHQATVLAPIPK